MGKKLNLHTEIKDFQQYWREDKPWGMQFKIATSEKTYVIDCKWKDRVRLPDGRVVSNVLARKVKNG